jgi:zinc protease
MNPTAVETRRFLRRRIGPVEAILLPRPGSGLIALQVYVRRGSADEGAGEIGLASFTATMLKRGTESRSSARIAFDLESLGAMAGHGAGADSATSSLKCAVEDFPAAAEVFFDCLRRPRFDPNEVEIEREATIAHLMRADDDKFDFTYRHYVKRLFADHGYGHLSDGEIEDVEAITPEGCRDWHARRYHPDNMLIAAAGDFDSDALAGWIEPRLADWASPSGAPARCETPVAAPGGGETIELKKELEQGFIIVGYRTPPFTHPDRAALRLASAALGEGFSGRLFTNLRDRRSLAYAVGCSLATQRLGGQMMLYIGTQPDRLDEAREGLLAEAEALRAAPLDAADFERARQYVAGKYIMAHQSLAARAGFLASWEDLGLGAEYDDRYLDDLMRVTADRVREAAERWWIEPTVAILRPE